ncbi:hypothetical protein [Changchengzhania lutea]|uniref:hypothetical protein n=1 Tax=Changchengzhania lutea TaxID=2049305 RepID=UPI00115F5BAE|nr:hypothetical protein [Changchengzhania lutea]
MKKHVIIVSTRFLKAHPRAGEFTGFPDKVLDGTKIHTLRKSYKHWKKKIDEVNAGVAELHVRTWTDRPFISPQKSIKILGKGEVGIQKCQVLADSEFVFIDDHITEQLNRFKIEENDGLSTTDFWSWFTEDAHDACVIHFTNKKY